MQFNQFCTFVRVPSSELLGPVRIAQNFSNETDCLFLVGLELFGGECFHGSRVECVGEFGKTEGSRQNYPVKYSKLLFRAWSSMQILRGNL